MNMNFTKALIISNVIIFFLLESMGQTESAIFMMENGAVYPSYLYERGEYWRLFTATFMHFGLSHLLHNMVMLAAAGQILERALGQVKYVLLYFLAGIGGSALSYAQMMRSGEYAVAAGASGAIYGVLGALAWVVLIHKGRYETLTGKGMVGMLILCMYYGVSMGNVDNWGHIGGLIMGFLLSILFYRRTEKKIDFKA